MQHIAKQRGPIESFWFYSAAFSFMLSAAGRLIGAPATAPAAAAEIPVPARPPSTQPAPIIHVDTPEHDFGDVWAGTQLEHTFTIYNRGTADLEIRGVRPQCGCTLAGAYPRKIEPGQSGNFPFQLRTHGLRGRIAPKTITVTSNDPVTPTLMLRLLGTFKQRIEVTPPGAAFGPIIGDQPLKRVLKIKNNTEKPLELQLRPPSTDRLQFELTEKTPGKEFELQVSTVLPYKPGEFQVTAYLQTNIDEEKVVRIVASGRVPERLDLYPLTATYLRPFRTTPGQKHSSLYFWLNNYGASLVNVKEASVDDAAFTTTVESRFPGKNYRIQVNIPLNTTIPAEGRTLTIQTDDPEKPTLQAKILPHPSQRPPTTRPAPRVRPAELMVGKPAPAFHLTTFDSKPFSSGDLAGKITVLNFISPICPWCKKQVPQVEAIRANYQEKGVRFINVVNPNPSRRRLYTDAEITQILASLNSKLEVASDTGLDAGKSFQATSYPTLVIVGKDSKIAAVDIGFNKVGLVRGQLDALLAGKPIPATSQPN